MKMFFNNSYFDMCQNVLEDLVQAIERFILLQDSVSIVISGGTTPKLLYELLSSISLDWKKVTITTCDEHVLEINDAKRYDNFIKATLLNNEAAKANFFSLDVLGDFNIDDKKSFLNSNFPFEIDILLLGLGIKGHIASIFPDAANINDLLYGKEDLYKVESTLSKNKRLTMGLNKLLSAKRIIFVTKGEEKLRILTSAILTKCIGQMPVKAFLKNDLNTTFFWCPD